jgi:hypothetical protein
MKAKDFNGTIKTWRRLPKTYQGDNKLYMSFDKASDSVQQSEGFYNVIKPSYDSISQRLGSIEFDSENEVFTYPVIDIDFDATYEVQTPIVDEDGEAVLDSDGEPTYDVTTESTYKIDELKSGKKKEVNEEAGRLLKPTDWYVIRKSERDIDIPTDIATERADIITKANGFVDAIDALETVESVLRYTFAYYPSEDLV